MNTLVRNFLFNKLTHCADYREGLLACCPFHNEDTPSFFVFLSDSPEYSGWFYKCHGCKKSGSLRGLLTRLKAGEALINSAPTSTVKSADGSRGPAEKGWKPDGTKHFLSEYSYYQRRGISIPVCERFAFKLDFNGPAAIMPVYLQHRYLGYIRRNLDPSLPRYIMADGIRADTALWGFDTCDTTQPVYIMEGIIDAACFWSRGLQAIALCNKHFEKKLEMLSQLTTPICVPDNMDAESFRIFGSLAERLCGTIRLLPAEFKDTSEMVEKTGQFALI